MKNFIRNNIFGFILGALIFGSIGVYAASLYSSSDVTYKNTTVEAALNELYSIPKGITSNVTLEEIARTTDTVSNTTITNVNNYKYYFVTNIWYHASVFNVDNGLNWLSLSATNSTLVDLGNSYYQYNNSGAISRSYLIFPDGSQNDIVLSMHGDGMTIYGIK